MVDRQMAEIRALPLEPGNDKWRYLSLLDDASPLKHRFEAAGPRLVLGALDARPDRRGYARLAVPQRIRRAQPRSVAAADLRGIPRVPGREDRGARVRDAARLG
ncbi:MAG: hypothetical protein ACXWLR_06345 [Myxococcales bacterium]